MAGQVTTKTFSGGMNKDLDFSLLKDNQYYDAQNYKLISDENSNGFILENSEGNSQWLDISGISGIDDTYYMVGHCYIQPYLVLFYTTNDKDRSPNGGTSKIVRLTIDRDEIQEASVIYDDSVAGLGNLNFSTTYPIKAVGQYETNDIIKVYWTDGYNDVRWVNVMDSNLATYAIHMFELVPDFPFNATTSNSIRLQFDSYTQGNIDCSAIQYAYQYYIPNGAATVFAPASAMIQIPKTNSSQSEVVAGGDRDENSGYGVISTLVVDNDDFTKIRFVAIEYNSYNGVPTIRVFSERDLSADIDSTLTITDVGETVTEITYDEYLIQTNTTFKAKDLAIKDNYLFAGNIREELFDVDADCRAYRHNSSSVARIYESDLASYIEVEDGAGGGSYDYDAVPETHDCINLYNKSTHDSVDDEYTNINIFQADGSTVGAEGDNIQVLITTNANDIIDTLGTSDLDKWQASTFLYEPGQRSWQRNEVYRIGVVFRNAKMQPSPVKWICDFKIPPVRDVGTTPVTNYKVTYDSTGIRRQRIGIAISWKTGAAVSWGDTGATSFELVAVPRSSTDRSILGQGIVQQTFNYGTDSDYYPTHAMVSEGWTYTSGSTTNSQDLIRFISPEVSFNKNLDFQDEDFLHYTGYLYHAGANTGSSTGIYKTKVYDTFVTGSGLSAATKKELDAAKVIGYVADIDYRTTVGLFEYQPYVKPSPTTAGIGGACTTHLVAAPNGSTLSGWWDGLTSAIPIANYKRNVFTSQYGGIDYYSRLNNTYISVSDPEVPYIGTPAVISYEGDTFIDWFYYNNVCVDLDLDNTGTHAASFLFPVESSISLSHRLDDGIHRNLGSLSAQLTQEISGSWEADSVDGTVRVWEQDTPLYQYNPVYSQQSKSAFYLLDNDNVDSVEVYPTRIKRSELKINGEQLDSFTVFKVNNFIDLNGQYGSLNNLEIFNNNLYYWQDSGFGIASVNTRSLIEDNNTGILALGTGGVLDRIDYISDSVGNQNTFGITKSRTALYWADNNKNELFKFGDGLKSVSKLGGIQTWINEQGQIGEVKAVYDHKYNDVIFTITFARTLTVDSVSGDFVNNLIIDPETDIGSSDDYNVKIKARFAEGTIIGNQGVITPTVNPGQIVWQFVEDPPYGNANSVFYVTIDNDPTTTHTITFNELVNSFVSFNSFEPARHIQVGTNFISTDDYHDLYMHNDRESTRCTYYGTTYDSTFTTIFNKDFPYTKVWDGLKWYSESEDSDGINQFKDTIDSMIIYNDYQHIGDRTLYYKGDGAPPAPNLGAEIVRRDRTFSMQIPRNIVDTDVSSNPDIQDSGNWDETQTFKDRIRDKYMLMHTTYDNTNGYTFSMPFISATYRKSAR